MLSAQVIIEPAGTDWGTIIAACLATVGTLAGVVIGSMSSRRAQTNAVKRKAYAGYLIAVAPLFTHFKQHDPPEISPEELHALRATRYAAELVGSTDVADKARNLSAAVGEPQAQEGANFSVFFEDLIGAMRVDLQRKRRWPWRPTGVP